MFISLLDFLYVHLHGCENYEYLIFYLKFIMDV